MEAGCLEAAGLPILDVGRDGSARHDRRDRLDRGLEDVAQRSLRRERLGELEQRSRGPRRLARGGQQGGVLERDAGVRGQDLEEPPIDLVEHPVAEARQDDHADDIVAREHRHGEHRLEEVVVGPRDGDRERDLAGIGGEDRRPRGGDGSRDAFADRRDELVEGLFLVLGEQLALEGDRQQGLAVGLQEVDPAVVVVEDRSKLRRDRRADLLDVAQGVQLGAETVEHVELRDRPVAVGPGHRLSLPGRLGHPPAS